MDPDPKPARGQRSWTDAQRAEHAKCRACKVWAHSTGPRTELGKRISSRNSYKHGRYTFDRQVLRWYTRLAALRVKQAKAAWIMQEHKFKNELIDRWNYHNPKKPRIMAFYPYFEVHPLSQRVKTPPKAQRYPSARQAHAYFSRLSEE